MLTDKITTLIADYNNTALDAVNLPKLMEIRQKLVCLGYELGVETAKFKREFDSAYASRKINFFKSKSKYLDEGVSKAEVIAEMENSTDREVEKNKEGLYSGCKIILSQCNQVIGSLVQDISILKTEFNNQ